jgi:Holliday junction DNA helicase RuvA
MIGKLKGVVDSVEADHVVLDVAGVGYEVHCPGRVLAHLPRAGAPATLVIETHVREDAIRLYGFATPAERAWFRLLTTVQGVGAKVALSILGVLSADDLSAAIALQDKVALTRAPGVGRRLAERLVTELKDAAGDLVLPAALGGAVSSISAPAADPAGADAVSALVNLGYAEAQARGAVAAARAGGDGADMPAATLIRLALKELAR